MNLSAMRNQDQCFPGHGVLQTLRAYELPPGIGVKRKRARRRALRFSDLDCETQARLISYRILQLDRDDLYHHITAFNLRGVETWFEHL